MSDTSAHDDQFMLPSPKDITSQQDLSKVETQKSPVYSDQTHDISSLDTTKSAACNEPMKHLAERNDADIADRETVHGPALIQGDVSEVETVHSPALSNQSVREDVAEKDVSEVETTHNPIVSGIRALHDVSEVETVHRPAINKQGLKNSLLSIKLPKSKALRIMLVIAVLIPTLSALAEVIGAISIYSRAHDGVQRLLQVKELFVGSYARPSGLLDEQTLQRAQEELAAAHESFQQVHGMVKQGIFTGLITLNPKQATSIDALSEMGMDIADMGKELTKTAQVLAPSFRGPMLTDASRPLVTPAMLALVNTSIKRLLPHLDDIQLQARRFAPDSLPMSAAQRLQLSRLLQAVPQVRTEVIQGENLLYTVGWMLGVYEPRTFLVQTMDRSELRPTGGFTGQFGELLLKNGRIAPFALKNIGPYEENNPASLTNGQLAPPPFRSWWPIPNWGLRDANLSADFPTSARIASAAYEHEFKRKVDGVMLFSPFLIAHVLQITGPIALPAYHERITAQNLEERLHYYQLDNAGIRKEQVVEHVTDPVQARKLFTASLARTLMDVVRHAPPDELIAIGRELLNDLKTRDLQVYVNDGKIEDLLVKMGAAAQLDRSRVHDGLSIVQANLSANKASQYVRTLLHDVVTLDAQGGATHHLQMQLIYNQMGPVYGLDTYRDYVRIYVPPGSRYLWGDGFDTGMPSCGGALAPCPSNGPYPRQELICPEGRYQAGAATTMLNDPYVRRYHPLDRVGAPTNFVSDEPGRAMFAGWVVVPKNCTMTVMLSWYVPALGHAPYTLLIQRQSSTFPALDLTILPTLQDCGKLNAAGRHFNGIMSGQDMLFSTKLVYSMGREEGKGKCYSQVHV